MDTARQITTEEKVKELEREIAMRSRVYAKRIYEKKMTEEEAIYRVGIIRSIVNDYKHPSALR